MRMVSWRRVGRLITADADGRDVLTDDLGATCHPRGGNQVGQGKQIAVWLAAESLPPGE